jgi:hypothetical protein
VNLVLTIISSMVEQDSPKILIQVRILNNRTKKRIYWYIYISDIKSIYKLSLTLHRYRKGGEHIIKVASAVVNCVFKKIGSKETVFHKEYGYLGSFIQNKD